MREETKEFIDLWVEDYKKQHGINLPVYKFGGGIPEIVDDIISRIEQEKITYVGAYAILELVKEILEYKSKFVNL